LLPLPIIPFSSTTAYLNLKNNESILFFFISLTNIQNVKNNLGKCEKQFYVYMKGSVTNVKKSVYYKNA
jgi:hypothetical protein